MKHIVYAKPFLSLLSLAAITGSALAATNGPVKVPFKIIHQNSVFDLKRDQASSQFDSL